MTGQSVFAVGLLLFAAAVASCKFGALPGRTEFVLEISSDIPVPEQMDAVAVHVARADGLIMVDRTDAIGDGPNQVGLPLVVTLVPVETRFEAFKVRVEGLRGSETVVSRTILTSFVPEKSRLLRMSLAKECLGVICAEGLTCGAGGECSDVYIDPAPLPAATQDAGAQVALETGRDNAVSAANGVATPNPEVEPDTVAAQPDAPLAPDLAPDVLQIPSFDVATDWLAPPTQDARRPVDDLAPDRAEPSTDVPPGGTADVALDGPHGYCSQDNVTICTSNSDCPQAPGTCSHSGGTCVLNSDCPAQTASCSATNVACDAQHACAAVGYCKYGANVVCANPGGNCPSIGTCSTNSSVTCSTAGACPAATSGGTCSNGATPYGGCSRDTDCPMSMKCQFSGDSCRSNSDCPVFNDRICSGGVYEGYPCSNDFDCWGGTCPPPPPDPCSGTPDMCNLPVGTCNMNTDNTCAAVSNVCSIPTNICNPPVANTCLLPAPR